MRLGVVFMSKQVHMKFHNQEKSVQKLSSYASEMMKAEFGDLKETGKSVISSVKAYGIMSR